MGSRLSVKPHMCRGCHNPETWPFDAGIEIEREEVLSTILEALDANGIHRNFSILGGEPLAPQNREGVAYIIKEIKKIKPDIKIYLWTGYEYENLIDNLDESLRYILNNINTLIDGPYIEAKRDITLHLRGSSNQRILYLSN